MGATSVSIRRYEDGDSQQVLALLRRNLTGWASRSDDWFFWKHFDNPAGKSLLHVAEIDGTIVGFRAFMRWVFRFGEGALPAVRGADAVVDLEHRRRGIWESLTHAQVDEIPTTVRLAFSYGHPDTRAGYRKLGWHSLGLLNKGVIPRRPDRIVVSKVMGSRWDSDRATRSQLTERFEPIGRALEDPSTQTLVDQLQRTVEPTITTQRDFSYLKWRYSNIPGRRYVVFRHGLLGKLSALLVLRSRQAYGLTEIEIAEMLTAPGEERHLLSALARVLRQSGGDYLAIPVTRDHPSKLARVAERAGASARLGHGNEFLYRILGNEAIAPLGRESWSFSLGDFDPGF